MGLDEILQRQQHLRHLETRENEPVTPHNLNTMPWNVTN